MTMPRVEVITSVERRRSWSREEKERLVAASFEPGASTSEVARSAGIHVSQLFRWRKDLCDRVDPGSSRLVPVEIVPAVAPPAVEAPAPSASPGRRRRKAIDYMLKRWSGFTRFRIGGMSHANRIARIRIQLDDWQPAIWRRAEVPLTTTLKALHDVIQAAMPFDDYHLFEFRADGKRYAIPDPEWDSLRDKTYSAKTMRLGTLVDRGITQLAYTYDFGDDWRHAVTIEEIAGTDPAAEYPRYMDGAGRAPPEDVGGIPDFELFLDAIADPKHEQHRELKRWHGRPFDPEHAAEDEIRHRMGKLARRRALGKAGFEKSRSQTN